VSAPAAPVCRPSHLLSVSCKSAELRACAEQSYSNLVGRKMLLDA
jgi:hypothetical protein